MKMSLPMKTKTTQLNPTLMRKVTHTLQTIIMGMYIIMMIITTTNMQRVFEDSMLPTQDSLTITDIIQTITGILTTHTTGV